MVYQVLIVDDEPIVREGIKTLLPWEDYGFTVCGEGTDGKDGLYKTLALKPDLVLVDIKMPGLSGIELIKEARDKDFEGKFIILTGYSDFEFAKSAISLGVNAYLLKPIDEDELIKDITAIAAELNEKKHLEESYHISIGKARREVLRRLLLFYGDKKTFRLELQLYNLDFCHDRYCVAVLCRKRCDILPAEPIDMDNINVIVAGETEQVSMEDKLILIGKGCSYQELSRNLSLFNKRQGRQGHRTYYIAVGHTIAHLEDIHFSYECARMLLSYQFLFEEMEVVTIQVLEESRPLKYRETFAEKLCSCIEAGNTDGIRKLLEDRSSYYRRYLIGETEVKVDICRNMVMTCEILEKHFEDRIAVEPGINTLLNEINNGYTLSSIIKIFFDYCMRLSNQIGSCSTQNVVERVLFYMSNNYSSDLKIEAIAKLFHYNSAYLGKIFKEQTGISFNHALDSIRIQNAKKLLMETDLKVYQVSKRVGYNNIDYFYLKFKKYVGQSPKEFKSNAEAFS